MDLKETKEERLGEKTIELEARDLELTSLLSLIFVSLTTRHTPHAGRSTLDASSPALLPYLVVLSLPFIPFGNMPPPLTPGLSVRYTIRRPW